MVEMGHDLNFKTCPLQKKSQWICLGCLTKTSMRLLIPTLRP